MPGSRPRTLGAGRTGAARPTRRSDGIEKFPSTTNRITGSATTLSAPVRYEHALALLSVDGAGEQGGKGGGVRDRLREGL